MIRRGGSLAALLFVAGCVSAPPPPPPPEPVVETAPMAPPVIGVIAGEFTLDRPPEQGGIAYGHLPAGATGLTLDGKPVAAAPDGMFLIGFGRDHGPTALLEARTPAGILRQPLTVAPRNWAIQSIPSLRKGTTPTPDFLRRRPIELARIGAARRVRSAVDGWRQTFIWPQGGRISGVFGSQRIYAGEPGDYHAGVDIAVGTGTPVYAPADGVVVLATEAPFTLEGNLVILDHGMGLTSAFLHFSRVDVREGQRVRQGDRIGAVGATGRATGPHLHWATMWNGERVDAQKIAGPMR
ncbi:peptidoglycan DD-metalloendopeptidase family protein [Sphingomonas naphthae]|uniref:Peptidoglycan DD-metalloendopeptidase family protein n=1 Tax=Sphingomonas naphthae TaxID=1813468 RepID=A0ABY7TLB8_9SPHN|nr:peptidoglycan DD-metalloendopeptidase family protein [Sphingomonas naphthae]WCT73740.1 peptidoglycan DD-metalloendopeptidase family protein [Sphingomonas naphthae]